MIGVRVDKEHQATNRHDGSERLAELNVLKITTDLESLCDLLLFSASAVPAPMLLALLKSQAQS